MFRKLMLTALVCGVAGCLAEPLGAGAPVVVIDVAPLSLEGVSEATDTLTVANSLIQEVWSRQVTSGQYGDGAGSISYVGPCDAAANPNTVTLVLDGIQGPGGQTLDDSLDPGPLSRSVVCEANADRRVTFDITIARRASQGFFDVAVSFGDLFCSAKLEGQVRGRELQLGGRRRQPAAGAAGQLALRLLLA